MKFLPFAAFASVAVAQSGLRYMPLGDSITEIICWRSKLWHMMQDTEFARVDWVGSITKDNNCGDNQYDHDHEGHGGFLAINIANQNQLVGWLRQNPADVITMHLGTNDILQQRRQPAQIIQAYSTLVNQMRDSNPRMKIIVAQIIPMSGQNDLLTGLNAAIPAWAASMNTTESPIWVVDQATGFNGASDNRDGLHPNDSGDRKMAEKWFPYLLRAFQAAANETAA